MKGDKQQNTGIFVVIPTAPENSTKRGGQRIVYLLTDPAALGLNCSWSFFSGQISDVEVLVDSALLRAS